MSEMNNESKSDGMEASLPVIDMFSLFDPSDVNGRTLVAAKIGRACRTTGFFYVTGHGIDLHLLGRLEDSSRSFFALPLEEKMRIEMARGGRAWRGYFPPGGELTSGRPDLKEGIYFGTELDSTDERVKTGLPLHGSNQFPDEPASMRQIVLDYLEANTRAAHALMEGIALSLGLEAHYFRFTYTSDPTILFRIFHYPPPTDVPVAGQLSSVRGEVKMDERWGVGEHTDYGLLTLLAQDNTGGLQVKTRRHGWIDAPPIPGTIVCNIGDMLDRLTGGVYRSTPHRVRRTTGCRGRLSFPFFFDPGFNADIRPLPVHVVLRGVGEGCEEGVQAGDDKCSRWDKESVHEFRGLYGDYLLAKVSRVFPQLRRDVI